MVDRLKRSLDQLEPPTCPNCRIEMRWSRSALIKTEPATISHVFTCPNCHRIAETKSEVNEQGIPPGQLSEPSKRSRAA